MPPLDVTLLACWTALAILGAGAVWDLTLAIRGRPQVRTFCAWLRRVNTASNDLLAASMLALDGYLFTQWLVARDDRLLFVAWAFLALDAHLWLLQWLHAAGIQSKNH